MSKYEKSLDDEIDWKIIDQLHAATMNFSSTSIEIKKLLFVLIGVAVPTLITLARDTLDISLFITLYVLILTFWFLDGFTYYYQEKLRAKMDSIFNRIKDRNENATEIGTRSFTIESTRTSKNRFWRSMFNKTVALYPILCGLNTISLFLYWFNII